MAELVAGFFERVVRWVGAPIKSQYNCVCCFTSNITTLKLEAEELENAAARLRLQVDRATDDAQVIFPEVEAWLTNSEKIRHEMNGILYEVPNVESGCLKIGARFSLSKRAKKITDHMKELQGQRKFDVISHPGPPASRTPIPLGTTYEFESRKQIEEDIMTSLRDGEMNMIGICGMEGLGKTTMAKVIMNRALKEHVFEEIVMVVLSQTVDRRTILVEIAGQLGLKGLQEEDSMACRVHLLHTRLTAGTKRILLVLDDIWEKLELEDLGIPRGCKGCTILLTSRNSDVLSAMDAEKVFRLEVLSKEDAWFLFRKRVGACVDDTGLNSIAKEVVEECRGSPVALITVGAALKNENDERIWKDKLEQLRKAIPASIPDSIAQVHNPLNVSYNKLESVEAKSILL